MAVDSQAIRDAVAARLDDATAFLSRLISTPSLSGEESAAMDLAAEAMTQISDVQRIGMSDALREDADYSSPIEGIRYDGRSNLRCVLPGCGGGKRLLFNTHIDTVPPAQGQRKPYEPTIRDGVIHGRGSCDAKGQVATIYLAMSVLKDLGVPLAGDVIAHIVAEEENGGNGSLAMVRHGEQADGCVVLEPTEMKIFSSIRGAVWFRVSLKGTAGHSGTAGKTRSALLMAVRVIEIFRDYHARLLAESRGLPLFDSYENPMPLTIGVLQAGNWPATAPSEAVLAGVLGLLPNKTARQVMDEMVSAVAAQGGTELAESARIEFTYRHDSSVCPPDHPFTAAVMRAAEAAGASPRIDAMTASCDAWLYNNQLAIPTVVFGGGSLGVAHSAEERMPLAQLAAAAAGLVHLACGFCGKGES